MIDQNQKYTLHAELYDHIVNGIKDYAIFVIKLNGQIGTWNPGVKRLLGYDEAEFVDKPFSMIFTESDRKTKIPEGEMKGALKRGKAEDERWHQRKDGTTFWASGLVTLMKDEKGEPSGFVKIMRDLTGKKKLEDALARQANAMAIANKELANFAGVVSHDLNAPLQTMCGFANILKTSTELDAEAKESVEHISASAKRMSTLVNELLRFTTNNGSDLQMQLLDTSTLVKEVVASLNKLITDKKAVISYDNLPKIWAEANQIRRVFQNLIENALKYSNPKVPPEIFISSKISGDKTIISVKDNGLGIDKKDFERIFILFERANEEAEFLGNGIGLASCKKIIERFDGEIWVESNPPSGSTFYFSLPNQPEVKTEENFRQLEMRSSIDRHRTHYDYIEPQPTVSK